MKEETGEEVDVERRKDRAIWEKQKEDSGPGLG